MFSQTVEYALRAIMYVAGQGKRPVRVSEIAAKVEAPRTYLAKILSQLASAGILESTRGRSGGFRMIAAPESLALADVAAVFDGIERRRCLLGRGICGEVEGCAAHERWAPVARSMSCFLADTKVSDLLHSPGTLS